MDVSTAAWVALGATVVVLLAIDLFFFALKDEEISLRAAAWASVGWTALGLAFTLVVLAYAGPKYAGEYLTGFVLEKSLSVDNLFVFAMIFGYFAIPAVYQRRVMFWGIVGAIVFRAIFIVAGAELLKQFHWLIYVFGAILLVTGLKMAFGGETHVDPDRNPGLRLFRRFFPLTTEYHGQRFFVRQAGALVANTASLGVRARRNHSVADVRLSLLRRSGGVGRS